MLMYKLNWGTHRVANKNVCKTFQANDVIETTQRLDEQFPLMVKGQWKFELLKDGPVQERPNIATVRRSPSESVEGASEQAPSTATLENEEKEQLDPVIVVKPEKDFGDDLTDEFPKAEDLKFRVYFNGTKYTVVNDQGKKLNTKKLAKPKDVNAYLKQFTEQ